MRSQQAVRCRVFVLGATNRPGAMDPAVLRPGRLDALIEVLRFWNVPTELGRQLVAERGGKGERRNPFRVLQPRRHLPHSYGIRSWLTVAHPKLAIEHAVSCQNAS